MERSALRCRALMSMVGLGSVSKAVLSGADVPVAVIRKDMELGAADTVCLAPAVAIRVATRHHEGFLRRFYVCETWAVRR